MPAPVSSIKKILFIIIYVSLSEDTIGFLKNIIIALLFSPGTAFHLFAEAATAGTCSSDRSKDKCLIPIKNRDRLWGRSPDVVNIKEKSVPIVSMFENA